MKAVIPAGGLGTRFLPATKAQPKEMLPVVDKPAIQYVVEEAVASGIDDIIIITGRDKRSIEDHFDKHHEIRGDNKSLEELQNLLDKIDVHYIRQGKPLGLGHAILCAKKHINHEPFAVLLGDDIIESEIPLTKQLMDLNNKYNASIIAAEEVPQEYVSSYGIIKYGNVEDSVYEILDLIEKPKPEEAPSNLGIMGRYVLMPEIFECIEKTKPGFNNEIQLTDALRLLKKTQKMYALKNPGKRFDIGKKSEYIKIILHFALKHPETRDELIKYLNSEEVKKLIKS